MCKGVIKQDVTAEDFISIKKKLSILSKNKKDDALKASQKLARYNPLQTLGCKYIKFSFDKCVPGMPP